MELIHHKAEVYVQQFTSVLDEVLMQNEADTVANNAHAQMHSGHVQGKLLEMISTMIKPLKILEIGTFTGFSAMCLAKGLLPGGQLHTLELRKEDAANAEKWFIKAGLSQQISIHVGNALDIIPALHEKWDLVFIDADKVSYIEYYELTLPHVNKGGWILADNVLFHGQVLEQEIKGKNAIAMDAFNRHIAADRRVEQVMLTVRDGLMLIRKL